MNKVLNKGKFLTSFFCIVLCLVALPARAATNKSAPGNSFANPDFAFPKRVEKNASAKFKKALADKDGLTALRAAIQLDVAASLIDGASCKKSIARFDSLAGVLSAPYNSLALLLEANLYHDIYSASSWKFDRRVLPLNPRPADVYEWSGDQFAATICNLINRSFADRNALDAIGLSEIKPLLRNADDAIKAGFSVSDFMTVRANDLLGIFADGRGDVIPFGNPSQSADPKQLASQLRDELLESAISVHAADADKQIDAYFSNLRLQNFYGNQRSNYLKSCLDKFGDTRWGAHFVADYCAAMNAAEGEENNALLHRKYKMLTDYRDKFPDAPQIAEVNRAIDNLLSKSVSVNFNSQLIPGQPVEVTLSGANVYDFYLLAVKLPDSAGNNRQRQTTFAQVAQSKSPVQALHLRLRNVSPEKFDTVVRFDALEPGCYTFVTSKSPKCADMFKQSKSDRVSVALVSDLRLIRTLDEPGSDPVIYVVSAVNQKPIEGAKVKLTPRDNGRSGTPLYRTTDKNGKVSVPNADYDYFVEHGGNTLSGYMYRNYRNKPDDKESLNAHVMTDLSIYKPGQELRFSTVAYTKSGETLKMAADRELVIMLADANGQQRDSLTLVTDRLGRADGSFSIPDSGLLGNWSLQVYEKSEKHRNSWLAAEHIEVADYKSPTFYAAIESSADSYKAGDVLRFNGVAMTYAGMPVANGKVAYSITLMPMWRFGAESAGSYGGETVTAADGSFSIELPTSGLKGTSYASGRYRLAVSVTDGAGETQQAAPVGFSLGSAFAILTSLPDRVQVVSDTCSFDVKVTDLTDHPVRKALYYEVKADDKVVKTGEFISPSFQLPVADLKSGRYEIRFSLNPEFRNSEECAVASVSTLFWRESDVRPPVSTPLWVPVTEVVAPKNAKSVRIKVGSSYDDSWILALSCTNRKHIRSEWLEVSDGFVEMTLPVSVENERTFVELIGMRDLESQRTRVTVIPFEQSLPLKVEQHTFRESIAPGSKQSWKFRFSLNDVPAADIPVMAVMTNKALNAIRPFQWSFNPYGSIYRSPVSELDYDGTWSISNMWRHNGNHKYNNYRFETPCWNFYGYSLYGGGMDAVHVTTNLRSTKMRGVMMMNAAKAEAVEEEVAVAYESAEESADAGAAPEMAAGTADEVPLRDVECPLAFFMPRLITGDDGLCSLDFIAPEFIGTWQLQVLGYTPEMKGAMLTLDSESAKPVMAQMNAPRFVRTGDKVDVAATIFNNSDSVASLSCSISISDAVSGKLLAEREFALDPLAPSGSDNVQLLADIPSGCNALRIRVIAEGDGCSDGEQCVIPVLPSSQPVMESDPFYIAPDAGSFSHKLPKFDKDASVTLSYCDNPVWECVEALPGMLEPESVSVMSKAYALFGNAVAGSLFAKYPRLVEGIRQLSADSLLHSNLEKDKELKSVMLNNTPWVNDARSETLRMKSLVDYADTDKARRSVERLVEELRKAQLADGGWSWCPGMESSSFITSYVLHILAQMKNMDCLPDDAEKMAVKAFRYVDNAFAEAWNKSKREYVPVTSLLQYLYDKSAFKGVGATSSFKPLDAVAMRRFAADWRDFGISDKATAAMLFERRGNVRLARTLLESLRQFASVSEEKGMWFANLSDSRGGNGDILATGRVLEAYDMIEPQSPAVDMLRQWLVVSKQVQNWGDSRMTAAAIHALLTSGSDWTGSSAAPVITLNGNPMAISSDISVTGSFTIDLDPAVASGAKLEVKRSGGGPAWGGVVASYVAPILDVKSASVPQLSIEKSVYAISNQAHDKNADTVLKKGDKVRVTLTIVCDRNLDYVAVTDPRAACLEPADQLSGYTSSDGVWYYREVRNSQTNLFIPYLPKGTHVINYECYVDRDGVYTSGVAGAQSQYAPVISAHSSGMTLTVK